MARTQTEESLAGQIRGLAIGQSVSRTARVDLQSKKAANSGNSLAKLRNLMNQAVGRIRKDQPGSNFRVESAVAITDDKKALLATVAVTLLDGPAEADDEEADI